MDDFKEQIKASFPPSLEEDNKDQEFVVLFTSFDLVNSTAFKATHQEWPVVISKFYEITIREILNVSDQFKLWKFVGDEVLFYRVVPSFEILASDVKELHDALNKVVDQVVATFPQAKNFLSVKGTLWVARVTYIPPSQMQEAVAQVLAGEPGKGQKVKNIMVQVASEEHGDLIDFLGPDVDAGFRIAKFAEKRKLVISAHLARCLMSFSPRESIDTGRLRIVTKEELKGVWGGRPYPIIWYYHDWANISDTFYYDEVDRPGLIKQVIAGHSEPIEKLKKIYSDLNKEPDIEEIKFAVEATTAPTSHMATAAVNRSKLAEVHCAAICFNANGELLIGRRPGSKKNLQGKWEFGCGQLHLGQDFSDCLRESYKEDFSADLAYISDVPVSTYVIPGDRKVPGLLFYAEVANPEEVTKNFARTKHTEVQWVDPTKRTAVEEGACVPDFWRSVDRALDYRSKNRKTK